MKNKFIFGTIGVASLALVGTLFANGVLAGNGFGPGQMSEQVAEKLGISQDQLNTVYDEVRAEHRAERDTQVQENLEQAVSDGVITEDPKNMLLEHRSEMEKERAERRAEREAHRAEMEQWREDSGIDFDALSEYGVGGGPRGEGFGHGGMGHGMGMHR